MMKRMSFSETIFLFFLALIIFGPKKLPEIARMVGKWMAEFRRASNEFKSQIEQEIANLEVENRRRTILPPTPAPEGTASRALNASPSAASQPAASSTDSSTSPAGAPEMAALADPGDEPLFATATATAATADASATPDTRSEAPSEPPAGATEAPLADEAVTASTSQESHA
jgi:sec-independent protein translocase protein TatB